MLKNRLEERIAAVRRFNRFYTRQIGVLREVLLHSPFSLTEGRIMYELAQSSGLTATDLCRELVSDAGYVSRILARFEQQGLVEKTRAEQDGRQRLLHLTPEGRHAFSQIDRRSRDEADLMLNGLGEDDQQRLLDAMHTIEGILDKGLEQHPEPFIMRPHEPGDMGWVTHRHGVLYAREYGWNEEFEALVAQVVADFLKNYNPARERCWIAEMDGEIVGSVFVVQSSDAVAKLRLLLVEPKARGMGLGARLVRECIRFAKRAGYQKLVLWTNSVLLETRRIYQKSGFQLAAREEHHSFGHDLVGETWEMDLTS